MYHPRTGGGRVRRSGTGKWVGAMSLREFAMLGLLGLVGSAALTALCLGLAVALNGIL